MVRYIFHCISCFPTFIIFTNTETVISYGILLSSFLLEFLVGFIVSILDFSGKFQLICLMNCFSLVMGLSFVNKIRSVEK